MSKRKNDDMFPNALTYVVLTLLLVLTFGMLVGVLPTAQEEHTAELVRWEAIPARVTYVCEQTIYLQANEAGEYLVRGSYEGSQHEYTFQLDLQSNETIAIGFSKPVDAAAIWYYTELAAYVQIPNEPCEVSNG